MENAENALDVTDKSAFSTNYRNLTWSFYLWDHIKEIVAINNPNRQKLKDNAVTSSRFLIYWAI